MQLIGQTVKHDIFGKGVISGRDEKTITVDFAQGSKRFVYPDAFLNFLTFKDAAKQEEIAKSYDQVIQVRREQRHLEQERQERLSRLRTIRNVRQSHAVFDVREDALEAYISSGKLSTGTYLSGEEKGQPKPAARLKPNSACLLTYIPKDGAEKDRLIAGVCMVGEEFFGDENTSGTVDLHPDHSLLFNSELPLLYWDFAPHGEKIHSWGKVAFKYTDHDLVQTVLLAVLDNERDEAKKKKLEKLYRYFCMLNHLSMRPDED